MALEEYRKKRTFTKSPEPTGGKSRHDEGLRFVVQKHHASRLHYDFRLEVDGVLKSWAVPKGPSLSPKDKRLAMMVEDHPLDYRTFEGTIPEGNYGAGTVMVWDQGEVVGVESSDRKGSESELREGLEKGRVSFVLHGEKLHGEFSLVKLNRGEKNAWLLMKKQDDFASQNDVLSEDRSVITGRNLDEIAEGTQPKKRARTLAGKKRATPRPAVDTVLKPLPPARNGRFIEPMLATLVDEPFDRAGWLFEVKWDGFRAIAETSSRGARLYSRNQKSFDERFASIVETLNNFGRSAVFDGEVVVLDDQGRSDFQLLQNYQRTGEGNLRYYVFDLLKIDRRDLRRLPLVERKQLLAEVIEGLPNVLLSEHIETQGTEFFRAAQEQGLEGVIAKNGASTYRDGVRSDDWLKIKTHRRQEAVIGGYTEPKGSRKELGALVLGVFEDDELVYIGHTGGGFNAESLGDVRSRLEKLTRKTCPFATVPKTNTPANWVSPKLVCEVRFQEWTQDGRMRQPIFLGLREDKEAEAVIRERPKSARAATATTTKKAGTKTAARPTKSSTKGAAKKSSSSEGLELTNLQKVYWPDDGYTKGDLIDYYRTVSPVLLPLLEDRPMSLHRHPNGITKPSFFQKDVSNQPPPDWVETIDLHSESTNENVKFIVCQNEDSLLYIANLGCIELNPWHSRIPNLDNPDYMLIDLDPQGQPFDEVVHTALIVRKILEDSGAMTLCKTSGKRGIHIVVPLAAKYDFDTVRQFAELVANLVHEELPETTSVVRSPSKRRNKIYLDFLQNLRGQTVAAPYSVRPAPGATVSTPLKWSEVKKGLDPKKFTIKTTPRRLDRIGDFWKPVLGKGIDLAKVLKRLSREEK